jgi:hypothetical protein
MYGIVNKALEDLVKETFGEDKWDLILERSGVEEDFFISNEPYDDDITFKLAIAVSDEMKIPLEKVLQTFGEWWILRTSKEKYGGLMQAGGSTLKEFLHNLPVFHNRVMLIYPKLTPPEFKISEPEENSIRVHYYSHRDGLQEFVRGLLTGLGKMYDTPVKVELVVSRSEESDHDVFKVTW